jgi:hypothetical protein
MKKFTALILAAVLTLSVSPAAVAGDVSTFRDVAGHWGEVHLTKMIEAGIIVGDGRGYAMPDKPVTHSEADVMISKLIGLEHNYEASPDLPREEAIHKIREKFFGLSIAPPSFRSSFEDFDEVSDGFKNAILDMEYAGLISGWNGKINPHGTVTRAEFAALLSNAAGVFITEDTDFEGAELERAIIRTPGITVKNLTAEYLTVAANAITLEGCDLGVVNTYGDGEIYLVNTSVTEMLLDFFDVIEDEDSVVELMLIGC